jgi:hypothetical protein
MRAVRGLPGRPLERGRRRGLPLLGEREHGKMIRLSASVEIERGITVFGIEKAIEHRS